MTEARTDVVRLARSKTRVVVLGDPHGDILALDEVLSRERRPEVAIFSAGDNVGYADGTSSSDLCRALMQLGIPSVTGNHEEWSSSGQLFFVLDGAIERRIADDALAWLRGLPYRIRIECEAAPDLAISLVHTIPGWGYVDERNADTLVQQENATIVFTGHSHAPAIYTIRERGVSVKRLHPKGSVPLKVVLEPGARYVVDAGSLARPGSRGKRPRTFIDRGTYAALDIEARALRVYSFDKRRRLEELIRREIEENTKRARGGGAT